MRLRSVEKYAQPYVFIMIIYSHGTGGSTKIEEEEHVAHGLQNEEKDEEYKENEEEMTHNLLIEFVPSNNLQITAEERAY